ncbi:MAG: hypothetical protein DI617_08900 [Streptococcus pyogenes]|nr:MAG: hypothetical protein DI617_08900 [Streptococcus pyogenes]
MSKKRIIQVDGDTGEQIEGYVAILQPKTKNGFERWMSMSQQAFETLAMSNLTGETYRVLLQLLAVLDYENWIRVSSSEIAATLKMKTPNVSRATKKLVDQGVLIPGPKVGCSHTYRLNPSYGWKGSAKNHNNALKDRMKASGLSVIEGSKDKN